MTLPASMDSEKAALGAILLDEKYLTKVLDYVRIENFTNSWHREILRSMANLRSAKKTVDLVTVVEELRRTGKLEAVGGPAYVSSLIDGVPDQPNVEAYVANIREQRGAAHSTPPLRLPVLRLSKVSRLIKFWDACKKARRA